MDMVLSEQLRKKLLGGGQVLYGYTDMGNSHIGLNSIEAQIIRVPTQYSGIGLSVKNMESCATSYRT
jgi:hypothetical protein